MLIYNVKRKYFKSSNHVQVMVIRYWLRWTDLQRKGLSSYNAQPINTCTMKNVPNKISWTMISAKISFLNE